MESEKEFSGIAWQVSGGSFESRFNGFLQTVNEMQEEFAYLIHEIRTPLTAVIAAGELIKHFDLPPAEKESILDNLLEEARRINALLQEYFQVYREDPGTWLSRIDFTAISINELFQGAIDRFWNIAPKFRFQTSFAEDLPPVRGDRTKLDLVLRNLVANALKYSPQGGTVVLAAQRCGQEVVISVQDEGVGIAKESLENIFERSFRDDRPEIRQTRGAGLGLTMVRRIVENHGGSIRVESTPGKGSIFFFTLPQASAEDFGGGR